MNQKVYQYINNERTHSSRGNHMKKSMNMLLIIGIVAMVCMPIVNAIQTDTIYVGITGTMGGYNTYDYDGQRWGDYIVWTRALDIYDSGGNVNPDGDIIAGGGLHDPSWIMIQQISTGESWSITPDYDAGLRLSSPDYYYHAGAVSIYNNRVLYEEVYGTLNYHRTLYMYNITTNTTWQIPHGTLSSFTAGYEHQIFGDWIYFSHWGGSGHLIYVYNYVTTEGRRIDNGQVQNSNLGMNEEFMWFTDATTSPRPLLIYGLDTGKLTVINGTNVGANIYASSETSRDGLLGVYTDIGGEADSYIIDLEGMNITNIGGDVEIFWEDIASENLIVVDTSSSYDSYAPFTDGNYAVYGYFDNEFDIAIYDIGDNQTISFVNTSNREQLSHYYNSMIIYSTNQNSFIKNNDVSDDSDIYRSESDTENIGNTIISVIPFIIIILAVGFILGAFKLFGESAGSGGMI